MRRVQFADGRTRAFVNDQPVSVQVLRALGAALVEIHGQHDERAFVEAATHRALLDAFGGIEDDAAEVAVSGMSVARAKPRSRRIAPRSNARSGRPNGCATRSMNSAVWRRKPARRPRSPSAAPP